MEVLKKGTPRHKHRFIFDAELANSLVIKKWQLRSEEKYDSDPNPKLTALSYLQSILKCSQKSHYLITVSELEKASKYRSKKGIFWNIRDLQHLDTNYFEIFNDKGMSRLAAVVNLENISSGDSTDLILNWGISMILLTDMKLKYVTPEIEKWISTNTKSSFGYNYDLAANTLLNNRNMAILRYFPADNGSNEQIAIIGDDSFINDEVAHCISSIAEDK
ncbi:hypothetical protein [Gimesia aquarii]|uniref:Uncharacterized protein n=1 Tax=Gimesia aquarii TaxID=2527964 RepID=A0A517WV04_9PLAN|nr:hypothetical protein [Gimesia aquarii]QDU09058.1 hypothetical protein V202x_24290 [Gimesia aquarii]